MKALVLNNIVVDLSPAEFEVHSDMMWMDAPDGCEVGWLLENGSLVDSDKRTDAEKQAAVMAHIRSSRNNYLAASDWTQAADSPLSDSEKAAWAAYRQALRDIPASDYTSYADVVWPVAP